MKNYCCFALALIATPAACFATTPQIESSPTGPRVTIDGELFTDYRTDLGNKPILWPIVGPTGKETTRGFPMRKATSDEATDHVHHKSLWLGHQIVNGVDFWLEPPSKQVDSEHGRVIDVGDPEVSYDGGQAVLKCERRWIAPGGDLVCTDQTMYRFGASDDHRWIDYEIEFFPAGEPLTLGDAKDALLAVRVPGTMSVDSKLGGTIVNDAGQRDDASWGQRAAWVDYSGPVEGETLGIAMMSHPENDRARPRWHVRTYGLFAVNPFGEKEFPPIDGYKQGPVTVPLGDSLRLRYRVLLHRGDSEEGDVAHQFTVFAGNK